MSDTDALSYGGEPATCTECQTPCPAGFTRCADHLNAVLKQGPAWKQAWVTDWTQGRFARLAMYFEDLRVADILPLEEDDLTSAAEPAHRVLMRVFARALLNDCYPEHHAIMAAKVPELTIAGDGILDVRSKVLSMRGSVGGRSGTAGYMSIEEFLEAVRTFVAAPLVHTVRFQEVYADDLPFMCNAMTLMPGCRIVDLSYSHVGPTARGERPIQPMLIDLLRVVDFVCIVATALATTDHKQVIQDILHVSEALFLKLIFAHPEHLKETKWHCLMPVPVDQALCGRIQAEHTKFYARFSHHLH